jgi:thiosulfate dehydrogenase
MKRHRHTGIFLLSSVCLSTLFFSCSDSSENAAVLADSNSLWRGWNKYQIKPSDTLVRYGRELLENTAYYLGPHGTVKQITNGMNCQNCHLDGGTVPWGNNYSAVASTYPMFRARSGTSENIEKRVNDCLQRSLNGETIDSLSKEMLAIKAYMHWLGYNVKKGVKPKGSGLMEIPFMNRAADPGKGRLVYDAKCQRCHGVNGQGQKNPEGWGYTYPPLWGEESYTTAAGLYRLTRFAGYVKNNMPYGEVEYHNPALTDEEAWDVAAFVNTQPRPVRVFKEDWPDISKKPIDHPFGPYADSFPESQHKYGPFKPIQDARKKNAVAKN